MILTAPFNKGKDRKETKDSIENLVKHDMATVMIFMPREMNNFLARLSVSCSGDTPMAVVSYAGYMDKERVMRGTLGTIMNQAGEEQPFHYLLYVGDFPKVPMKNWLFILICIEFFLDTFCQKNF